MLNFKILSIGLLSTLMTMTSTTSMAQNAIDISLTDEERRKLERADRQMDYITSRLEETGLIPIKVAYHL